MFSKNMPLFLIKLKKRNHELSEILKSAINALARKIGILFT